MALFKEKSTQQLHSTIISEGAVITGDMALECSLFFDGKLEGTIMSSSEVSVGKNATIEGRIEAQSVAVFGNFAGEVEAELVEIKEGGTLKGKVVASELIIEPKGVFEGESHHKESNNTSDA